MNGIVAKSPFPLSRRLVRGILILGCCVLSISLIGAVHAQSRSVARRVQPVLPVLPVAERNNDAFEEAEGEPAMASFRPVTTRTLTVTQPAVTPASATPNAAAPALKYAPGTDLMHNAARPTFRVVMMEVTAYCPCKKCCGPRAQGLTASGRPVTFNGSKFVAADKNFSFNTRLLIPGYAAGQAVPVLDRGGAIKGNKLDVYFPTHEEARQWGRQFIPVTVLN